METKAASSRRAILAAAPFVALTLASQPVRAKKGKKKPKPQKPPIGAFAVSITNVTQAARDGRLFLDLDLQVEGWDLRGSQAAISSTTVAPVPAEQFDKALTFIRSAIAVNVLGASSTDGSRVQAFVI